MSEETIYDNDQEVKNASEEETRISTPSARTEIPKTDQANPEPAKKGISKGAAAGIAGGAAAVAGVGGAAAAVLMPKYVFPYVKDIARGAKDLLGDAKDFIGSYFHGGEDAGDIVLDDDSLLTLETPDVSEQLVGHDMDVATGINDSMSFGEAFAAARRELGAGGLFVWHGNTYGTYYANEWNAMSPEDQNQYWADVHHTTSTIEYDPTDDSVLTNDMADADDVVVDVDMEEPGDLEEVEVSDLAEVEPDIDPDNLGDTAYLGELDEAEVTADVDDVSDLDEVEVTDDAEEVLDVDLVDADMGDELEGLLDDEIVLEGGVESDVLDDMGEDDMIVDNDPDLSDLA